MFDMSYKTTDGRVVRGGMAFDAKGHKPVFATRSGSVLTEADWKKLGRDSRKRLSADVFDAETRLEMLRHYLKGRGLDEESIEEAIEHARADLKTTEAKGEDVLPVFILPLFYKVTPLDNESLLGRLRRLAEGTGLKVQGIYRLHLSDETRKANACLAGLGRTRRYRRVPAQSQVGVRLPWRRRRLRLRASGQAGAAGPALGASGADHERHGALLLCREPAREERQDQERARRRAALSNVQGRPAGNSCSSGPRASG